MSRGYKLRLQDILAAIARVESYMGERDLVAFKVEPIVVDSVTMNLMIIGEAANNIPDEVQAKYPKTDWRSIIGLRNIVTHEYFRLNLDIIWNVIQVELPLLKQQVKVMLIQENTEKGLFRTSRGEHMFCAKIGNIWSVITHICCF